MDLSWILGHARVSFHHSKNTISLASKSGKTALSDICKASTPPCKLNPLLFNGHLHTAWTAVKAAGPPVVYKRQIFESDDPRFAGTFAVDFVSHKQAPEEDPTLPPRTTYFTEDEFANIGSDDTKPMLITLHGLSGGSHEIYLRHVLEPLVDQSEQGDWEAIVVNSRGCAMSKITTGILYNARATWDLRQTVKWCRKMYPNRPLYAIGYSLGANILTNYLGEEGDACELQAAVVCSNPWKLEVASLALQRTWLGLNVYSKTMGTSMKKLFAQHADQVVKNGNIDPERVAKVTYLHEFDREIQCPTWGYPTEYAYYRDASSADSVTSIRIPTFAIHAEDDPIAVDEAVPYEEIKQNPYVVMCSTSTGGHLSWFEVGGTRWFSKPAVNFLQKMAREYETARKDGPTGTLSEMTRTATSNTGFKSPFVFEPMRRKMYLPEQSIKIDA
ncbi:AB-hydrolase YheT [Aureobasidium pullulans]|nr:AB-hydrolase YheT [Aureobasidium pullulans]